MKKTNTKSSEQLNLSQTALTNWCEVQQTLMRRSWHFITQHPVEFRCSMANLHSTPQEKTHMKQARDSCALSFIRTADVLCADDAG